MKLRLISFCVLSLFAAGCNKPKPIGDVPEAFYYKGAPVDPACFLDTTAQMGDSISLNVCTGKNKAQPEYKEDHFYGVEITDAGGGSPPYIYYRYLGEIDGNHVIHTISSGGGSSQISSVRLVELDGKLLRTVKRIAGGDRCNGGIVSASVVGSSVRYTKNITAYDLADLSKGTEAGFRRNSDLQSDARTCLGTATLEDDEVQSITLSLNPSELEGNLSEKGACFLGVYSEYFKPERVLDSRDVYNFGMDLNNKCGKLGK